MDTLFKPILGNSQNSIGIYSFDITNYVLKRTNPFSFPSIPFPLMILLIKFIYYLISLFLYKFLELSNSGLVLVCAQAEVNLQFLHLAFKMGNKLDVVDILFEPLVIHNILSIHLVITVYFKLLAAFLIMRVRWGAQFTGWLLFVLSLSLFVVFTSILALLGLTLMIFVFTVFLLIIRIVLIKILLRNLSSQFWAFIILNLFFVGSFKGLKSFIKIAYRQLLGMDRNFYECWSLHIWAVGWRFAVTAITGREVGQWLYCRGHWNLIKFHVICRGSANLTSFKIIFHNFLSLYSF